MTLSVCDADGLTSLSQLRRDPGLVDIQKGHDLNLFSRPQTHASLRRLRRRRVQDHAPTIQYSLVKLRRTGAV